MSSAPRREKSLGTSTDPGCTGFGCAGSLSRRGWSGRQGPWDPLITERRLSAPVRLERSTPSSSSSLCRNFRARSPQSTAESRCPDLNRLAAALPRYPISGVGVRASHAVAREGSTALGYWISVGRRGHYRRGKAPRGHPNPRSSMSMVRNSSFRLAFLGIPGRRPPRTVDRPRADRTTQGPVMRTEVAPEVRLSAGGTKTQGCL